MPMAGQTLDNDEIAYLLKLRETYEQTLRANRIKKAGFGRLGGPGYIDIEIAEAEKGIRLIDAQLGMVQPPQEIVEAIGPKDAGTMLVEHRVKLLDKKMSDALTQFTDKLTQLADQLAKVIETGDRRYDDERRIRTQRQKEHDERMTSMEQSIEAIGYRPVLRLAGVLLLGVVIGAVLYWAGHH